MMPWRWTWRRWAVLEEREGQGQRIVSRHFFRCTAEDAGAMAYDAWRNVRGELLAGRFAWDWTTNQPVRLKTPLTRIHPEMAGKGSLWPDTDYFVIQLPHEMLTRAPA